MLRQAISVLPRVSVVIPLYNKAKHIGDTLASVLRQTVQDFEVVVVDDGSTDGSADVVRAFEDPRIRLIQQSNAGESAARNRGISESRCNLIAFIDADDLWFPHFLETVLALRECFPDAGAYATAFCALQGGCLRRFTYTGVSYRFAGEIVSNYFRSCTLGSSLIWSSSALIPKHIFASVGGFPVGVKNGADLYMWAKIALQYPIAWTSVECAIWNLDAENRIAGRVLMKDAPFAQLLEAALKNNDLSREQGTWIKAYVAKYRIHYASISIAQGDRKTGLELLWRARSARGNRVQWWKALARALLPKQVFQLRDQLRHRAEIS